MAIHPGRPADPLTLTVGATDRAAGLPHRQIGVEYRPLAALASPAPDVLAAVRFGAPAGRRADAPLTIDVQLPTLQSPPTAELWLADGAVHSGRSDTVRYAHDERFLFAAIELEERSFAGIEAAAEAAYVTVRRFQQHSGFPHLLRMWNYLDAINDGEGDLERYRQFCVGRARGLDLQAGERYPAATAIGRQHATHQLQVFWLAGRHGGTAVENPRQVSAYHYPRAHGPVSPSFSRATVAPDGRTVLVSGTASIVGHISRHPGDALEQLDETLRNLTALLAHSGSQSTPATRDLLKVYLRDPALADPIAARLRQMLPQAEALFVAADICRRELLLEIECVRQT
jgi:chorismate lyase/3-hydroxybenzoate synthase